MWEFLEIWGPCCGCSYHKSPNVGAPLILGTPSARCSASIYQFSLWSVIVPIPYHSRIGLIPTSPGQIQETPQGIWVGAYSPTFSSMKYGWPSSSGIYGVYMEPQFGSDFRVRSGSPSGQLNLEQALLDSRFQGCTTAGEPWSKFLLIPKDADAVEGRQSGIRSHVHL